MQSPERGGQDKAEEDAAPRPSPVGGKLEDAVSTAGAVEQPLGDIAGVLRLGSSV